MRLTQKIVDSYNFDKKIRRRDKDDVEVTYTLSNGLELSCLTVCNNEPTDVDCLEGLDDFIYIETKEELDKLNSQTFEEICIELSKKNPEFILDDYI